MMILNDKKYRTLEEQVYYLTEEVKEIKEGGVTPGTTNYTDLTNKPSINGVVLVGNKSGDELGLGGEGGTNNYQSLENKPTINGVELNGNKTSAQLGITDTTYAAGNGLTLSGTTFSIDNTVATKANVNAIFSFSSGTLNITTL